MHMKHFIFIQTEGVMVMLSAQSVSQAGISCSLVS